jgi:hypothetical protein
MQMEVRSELSGVLALFWAKKETISRVGEF